MKFETEAYRKNMEKHKNLKCFLDCKGNKMREQNYDTFIFNSGAVQNNYI